MTKHTQNNPESIPIYQVEVQGWFSERRMADLDGMRVEYRHREHDGAPLVILTGPVADQAALRGLLNRLWDLNLALVCVVRLEE